MNRQPSVIGSGLLLAFLVCVFSLSGCTEHVEEGSEVIHWADGAKGDMPKGLEERFVKYWSARARLDWDTAYDYEAPHYRWAMTRDKYFARHRMSGKVLDLVVRKVVRLNPDVVELDTKLVLQDARTLKAEEFTPRDRWIRVNGEWFHAEKNPLIKFF